MALEIKQQTQEQVQQEKSDLASKQQAVTESIMATDIFKSLDLPVEPQPKHKEVVPQEEPQEQEEESQEPESQEEEPQEEEQPAESEEQESEEPEEELIPKSKIQSRIDKLVAQNKAMQAELEALKSKQPEPVKDDMSKRLEAMSADELKQVKRQVRLQQIKFKDDEDSLTKLLDLEDKVDQAIQSIPQRFAQAQQNAYSKAVEKISADEDIPDINKAAPKILEIAKDIYGKYPKLQKDIDGQAIALELAAEHYKQINKLSTGKSEVVKMKAQLNTLKKKTSLDTKGAKIGADQSKLESLRRNAYRGTLSDKMALVRDDPRFNIDALIPDELKEK